MTLLAISGSPSTPSINEQLLRCACSMAARHEIDLVSVRDIEAPFYSAEEEDGPGIPPAVHDLWARMEAADGILFATPEYNGGMPARLKNTVDWISRVGGMGKFFPRPLLLLSTSTGRRGGATVLQSLEKRMPWWGATLVGSFSLPKYGEFFDAAAGRIVQPDKEAELRALIAALEDAADARSND